MADKTDCFMCALAQRCMHGYELLYGMRPSDQAIGHCSDFIPADQEVSVDG